MISLRSRQLPIIWMRLFRISPGRRCAAIAAPLCPGPICGCPFGAICDALRHKSNLDELLQFLADGARGFKQGLAVALEQ